MKTFKEYLEDKFVETYPVYEDTYELALDSFTSNLPVSEIIIYAEGWMAEHNSRIRNTLHQITK